MRPLASYPKYFTLCRNSPHLKTRYYFAKISFAINVLLKLISAEPLTFKLTTEESEGKPQFPSCIPSSTTWHFPGLLERRGIVPPAHPSHMTSGPSVATGRRPIISLPFKTNSFGKAMRPRICCHIFTWAARNEKNSGAILKIWLP